MGILQQPIEKKLTSLLGAEVTFENLKLSPLAGRLEATGMIVASADPNQPLLRMRRIRAEVSIPKALTGQLVIKSLAIEGVNVHLVRRSDGTLNFPRADVPKSAPVDSSAPNPADAMKPSASPWQMEAQAILISEASLRFEDQASGYIAVADQIDGELKQRGDHLQFAFQAGIVSRRDRPADVGPMKISGEIVSSGGISKMGTGRLIARLELIDGLNLAIDVPNLSERRVGGELHGPLDIANIKALLPPQIVLPEIIGSIQFNGPVNVDLTLNADRAEGIHVREIRVATGNVRIPIPQSSVKG